MTLTPEAYAADAAPLLRQSNDQDASWVPICGHSCTFTPDDFHSVMMNLIQNPNILSNWLFRADILSEHDGSPDGDQHSLATENTPPVEDSNPAIPQMQGFRRGRIIVRRLIPRNTNRDNPLAQTCVFYESAASLPGEPCKSLLVYLPHVAGEEEIPFYHPKVRGLGYLHEWYPAESRGKISIHYHFFSEDDRISRPVKLERTAAILLKVLHKHGQGERAGYVKRVHHDQLVPQAKVQDRYHSLKSSYAKKLIDSWKESTDPSKHVFEDLSIAAFLIELWGDMYKDKPFPGFVDIGCGNGLLTYLLNEEGYQGWGFDARARKSWAMYNKTTMNADGGQTDTLQQRVLLPSVVSRPETQDTDDLALTSEHIQDGCFPKGTFIISNHADELTPWTPILATMSDCPWISIPCCSHSLTGAKYRAPPPRDTSIGSSAYASLVEWVADIAIECGWEVEREMLRIPSTRNAGLLGRTRTSPADTIDIPAIIAKYGGTDGYYHNVIKLLKTTSRSH